MLLHRDMVSTSSAASSRWRDSATHGPCRRWRAATGTCTWRTCARPDRHGPHLRRCWRWRVGCASRVPDPRGAPVAVVVGQVVGACDTHEAMKPRGRAPGRRSSSSATERSRQRCRRLLVRGRAPSPTRRGLRLRRGRRRPHRRAAVYREAKRAIEKAARGRADADRERDAPDGGARRPTTTPCTLRRSSSSSGRSATRSTVRRWLFEHAGVDREEEDEIRALVKRRLGDALARRGLAAPDPSTLIEGVYGCPRSSRPARHELT